MKKFLILAAFLALLVPATSKAFKPGSTLTTVVAQTGVDSAGALLVIPKGSQTIVIRRITIWYDNAANTNGIYAGIVTADAAHTRQLWLGNAMTSNGITVVQYNDINRIMDPATAQAGLRLFLTASASDSLMGIVEYEIVPK